MPYVCVHCLHHDSHAPTCPALSANVDHDDEVEVSVSHGPGANGTGWYAWESDYPDEGYVGFFDHDPTAEELAAICPMYRRAPVSPTKDERQPK